MRKSTASEENTIRSEWLSPDVKFIQCPIKASVGVLGKKWTLLVLRDIGVFGIDRFNRILESIPHLTPRVLSMRLEELEREGLIEKVNYRRSSRVVRWALTERGRDVLPILAQLAAFGSKWHADIVFEDKMPRTPDQLFSPKTLRLIGKG